MSTVAQVVLAAIGGALVAAMTPPLARAIRAGGGAVSRLLFAPVGRAFGDSLRSALVDQVDEWMSTHIAHVRNALDEKINLNLDTIERRLDDIKSELTINGGDSVKDRMVRVEEHVERIEAFAMRTMGRLDVFIDDQHAVIEEMWETLAEHDIDRRKDDST